MKIFSNIKNYIVNRFDEFIRKYLAGEEVPTVSKISSDDNMLKYSAIFACFRVLAETFASVPVFEYRKLKNGDREHTNETGLYDMLHYEPNEEMSAYNFWEAMIYQICAGGNAVALRLNSKSGQMVGLYPIQYQEIEFKRDKETRKLIYRWNNEKDYLRKDIFHIPGPSINGVIGMSILEYARGALSLGQIYETFSQNFYKNGAISSGMFRHPGHLDDKAFTRLKKEIKENYTGLKNAGVPMLLEHGLEYQGITINPVDAQLIENKKLQIEDICRFCRVPLHLVQNLDKATNNNIEHQSLEFVMYTMLPYFKKIEECINTQLLTPTHRARGYYYEFNLNTLLRGDSKSMAEAFATGRQWGWLSVNDIRKLLNMNKIDNGDIYLQPMNMIEAGKELPVKKDNKMIEDIQALIEGRT